MSLFKNLDKMEKQLRNQLNGLEYKPSDSMWNRIEKEMRGDFEHSLEQKLRKFDATPDPALWEKIEAELPIEKEKNLTGRIIIGLLLITLVGLSAYMVDLNIKLNKTALQLASKNPSRSIAADANKNENNQIIPADKHTLVIAETNIKSQSPTEKTDKSNVVFSETKKDRPASKHARKNRLINSVTHKSIPTSIHQVKDVSTPDKVSSQAIDKSSLTNKPIQQISQSADKQIMQSNLEITQTAIPVQSNSEIIPIGSQAVAPPTIDSANKSLTNSVASIPPFIEPISSNKNPINTDEDAPTNFSISIITGANLCFNHLVAPSAGSINFDKNVQLRNQLENTAIDWSGLFLLDYHLNDRLHISSGIGILNFSQSFYYNTTTPVIVKSSNENRASMINPNDSIIGGNSLSTRIKYSWTEIPIYITYRFTKNRRFNFELQGGLSFAFLSTVDAGMVNYDNVGVLLVKDKSAFPGLHNSFFISLNPTITYNLNPTVTLGLMPSAKASLNSMIDNNNWVQQYPYFMGLSATLRKHF